MHTVNPSDEANYRIVECQNPFCNICTQTLNGTEVPPSSANQGIVVYTCSNPSCSLCDGDYGLLLDIVSPTSLLPTDEFFFQENLESRNPRNITCGDDVISSEMFPKVYNDEIEQKDSAVRSSTAKRKLSGHLGYATKSRRHSTSTKLFSDDVDLVDENQLMDLALALELDKEHCLPDLQKDVITELSR